MAAMRRRRSRAMEAKWSKEVDMHLPPLKAGHSWHFRIVYDGSKSKVAQLPLKTPFNVVYVPWQTDHVLVDQQLGEIKFASLELLEEIRNGAGVTARRQSSMISVGSRSRSSSVAVSPKLSLRMSQRLSAAKTDSRRLTISRAQSRQSMLINALKVSSLASVGLRACLYWQSQRGACYDTLPFLFALPSHKLGSFHTHAQCRRKLTKHWIIQSSLLRPLEPASRNRCSFRRCTTLVQLPQ